MLQNELKPVKLRGPAPAFTGTTHDRAPVLAHGARRQARRDRLFLELVRPRARTRPTASAGSPRDYRGKVRFVGVDIDDTSKSAGQAFIQKHDWRFPVIWDPDDKLVSTFHPPGKPSMVLIDRHGNLAVLVRGPAHGLRVPSGHRQAGQRVNVSATGLSVAFAAGVVAFASPCVLPLIPGYLSFLGGTQATGTEADRRAAVTATIAFTLGFAAVFTLAGAGVGLVGAQFVNHRRRARDRRRRAGDRHGRADVSSAARCSCSASGGCQWARGRAPPVPPRPSAPPLRSAGRRASAPRWRASSRSPPPRAGRPTAPCSCSPTRSASRCR